MNYPHSQRFSTYCWLLVLLAFAGCASSTINRQDHSTDEKTAEPVYSVYLIGDGGAASHDPQEPVLKTLNRQLLHSGKHSAVIFLGDNVYPNGLPPGKTQSREQAENHLLAQLKTVEDYPGRVVFIPGNHDWGSSGSNGLKRIRREEQFIESYLDRGNTFLPNSGYPGPVLLSLANHRDYPTLTYDIQLIVLDTQWWLHPHEKPLRAESEEEQKKNIVTDLERMIDQSAGDEVLLAGHHPLFSYGRHGGKFPISTHFLPPVLGSIYIAYRNLWGYPQDITGYDDLKKDLLKSMEGKPGLIYASGHEHSLQYIPFTNGSHQQYQLVSGSASEPTFVKECSRGCFTYHGKGFIVIHYFSDRTKRVEFRNQKGKIIKTRILKANNTVETSNK